METERKTSGVWSVLRGRKEFNEDWLYTFYVIGALINKKDGILSSGKLVIGAQGRYISIGRLLCVMSIGLDFNPWHPS